MELDLGSQGNMRAQGELSPTGNHPLQETPLILPFPLNGFILVTHAQTSTYVDDLHRAQALADRFVSIDLAGRLTRYAHLVNPLMNDVVAGQSYYLHVHKLIAKIPRSRRWRTTRLGRRVMATALQVRQLNFPQLLALAA